MRHLLPALALLVAPALTPAAAAPQHALAMHGAPAQPADFTAMPYVNPDAPKGGRLRQAVLGTFDSLNPLIVKGLAAEGLRGTVYESLMARGYDEPFTLYGLLAESVETDAARSVVTFHLNPKARFSDGKPVTAADVVFSWRLLRDHGRPNYRTYYSKVSRATVLDPLTVRFDLGDAGDRELPLILGLMPILPQHAIDAAHFEETTLTPPVASGPYTVTAVNVGRSVTLTRNPQYWGRDLPINRGLWNFDTLQFDYYRDANAQFEAFTRGLADVRSETDPGRWVREYDIPARRAGRIVQDAFTTGLPKPFHCFVFNTRRPVFADIRVRQAITALFDFAWVNHNFFYDRFRRADSYFPDSELSSRGRPASAAERALLAPFPAAVRADVMAGTWSPPGADGSGRDRAALKHALDLLKDAGYRLDDGVMRRATGAPLTFEVLVSSRDQERLALALARDLGRAGITARVRQVDAVQYDRRRTDYDFDMIVYRYDQSLSPGNEQAFYWGAAAADEPGTRNYMGVKSAAVDAMIAAMLAARQRDDFVAAVRALDRVLVSGSYVLPLYYPPQQWVARWAAVKHPETTSLYGYLPETWWRGEK